MDINNVTIGRERVSEIVDELKPLLLDNNEETGYFDYELDPDWARYEEAEKAGNLVLFTLREGDELIGYAAYLVSTSLHYRECLQALNDTLFIRKESRGYGMPFIKWCMDELRGAGVETVWQHVKVKQDWGKVLERLGYDLVEKVYGRRLQ